MSSVYKKATEKAINGYLASSVMVIQLGLVNDNLIAFGELH